MTSTRYMSPANLVAVIEDINVKCLRLPVKERRTLEMDSKLRISISEIKIRTLQQPSTRPVRSESTTDFDN